MVQPRINIVTIAETKLKHNGWYTINHLRSARALKHMTQADLAHKVHVSRQTISLIEQTKQEPLVSLAIAIAETLEQPVEKLFTVKPYPAAPWRPDPWLTTQTDKKRWRRMLEPYGR